MKMKFCDTLVGETEVIKKNNNKHYFLALEIGVKFEIISFQNPAWRNKIKIQRL